VQSKNSPFWYGMIVNLVRFCSKYSNKKRILSGIKNLIVYVLS